MTEAQKKAAELIEKFSPLVTIWDCYYDTMRNEDGIKHDARQCALICVEEILNAHPLEPTNVDWDECGSTHRYWYETRHGEANIFWNEVKQELLK